VIISREEPLAGFSPDTALSLTLAAVFTYRHWTAP